MATAHVAPKQLVSEFAGASSKLLASPTGKNVKCSQRTKFSAPASCSKSGLKVVSSASETASEEEPLMVRAARGLSVPRPPAWMMRQAGRYMAEYRELAKRHPSFRERSETTELIVEISLQPWRAFKPDGVILFSDILTPLSAMGIPFEIDDNKGPLIEAPIRTKEDLKALHPIQLDQLSFVGESLAQLRREVSPSGSALLGFVGSPWTLATYCVEGASTSTYKTIKTMALREPELLKALLTHLANEIAEYTVFQIDSGAQLVQVFDSWGGHLTPDMWDKWSKPYLQKIFSHVRAQRPSVPLTLYANGSGGLLERMSAVGADVVGLDWSVDMADGRKRLGAGQSVQGNVDPAILFATKEDITEAIHDCVAKAGPSGHILNLGHGVLVGTPEESVAHFFDTVRGLSYETEAAHSKTAAASVLS